MAFVQSSIPEEQQNQFGSGAPTTPNPMSLLPPQTGGAASGGGPTTPSASGAGSPTQFGTSASKLSDYLSANADQVQNLGNTIAGKMTDQFNQVQGGVNQAAQDYASQVASGYTPYQPDLISNVATKAADVAKNPDQVKAFQGQYNDSYNGPDNFETTAPYAQVQNQVQQAVQNSGSMNTYGGLSQYLQSTAQGTYTPGMNTLDTVLVQGSQPAQQAIKAAAEPFKGLNKYLGDTASAQDTATAQAKQDAVRANQEAHGAITTANQNLNKNVQGELAAANKAQGLYNTDVNSLRSAAGSVNDALTQYLASHPQITQSMGDLSPWLNLQQIGAPTAAGAANKGDFDTMKALQLLSGQLPTDSMLTPDMESQIGSFKLPQDLQAALANGAVPQAMNSELSGIGNQIKGAYQPFQDLENREMQRADLVTQAGDLKRQMGVLNRSKPPTQINDPITNVASPNPAYADWQNQMTALQNKYQTMATDPNYSIDNYWPQIGQMGQGLQWLPGAATDYNSMLQSLQSTLGPLNGMEMPNWQPDGGGSDTLGKINEGVAVGNPAVGLAEATGKGIYDAGNFAANNPSVPLAYLANPLTLGLPPELLNNIGSGIGDALNSVGDFFGNLF